MPDKKRRLTTLLTVALVSMLGFSLASSVAAQEESASIEVHWRPCEEVPADGDWHGACHDDLNPVQTQTGRTISISNTETGESFQGNLDDANNTTITVPAGTYTLVRDAGPNVTADYLYCTLSDGNSQSGTDVGDPMTIESGQHIVCDYYYHAEMGGHLDPAPGSETEEATDPDSSDVESETTGSEESITELENIQMHIVPADCTTTDVDASVAELSPLTIGTSEATGSSDVIAMATSWTNAPVSMESLVESDHALMIVNSADGAVLACGNIGGAPGNGESLVIGLTASEDNENLVGVAYLQPDGDGVSISVFVREDVVNQD